MEAPHTSVLLQEILDLFKDCHLSIFVDATLGAGGHSAAILNAHPEIQRHIGIDQDPVALEIAKHRLTPWKEKSHLVAGNFALLKDYLAKLEIHKIDAILLDLGVSSMQFDLPEKGFSFMRNGPLDMRMNPENPFSAYEIVNEWSEEEIGRVFREYGEEKQWRNAAKTIVSARQRKKIETTHELADILRPLFFWKKKGVNPLTLIFQALRICVNNELEVIEKVIPQAIELLNPKGRLGVISFHSLEDRIVKNLFRYAADDKQNTSGIGGVFLDKEPTVKLLTRKPITPSEEEIQSNPRSRSAKLRFIEKL